MNTSRIDDRDWSALTLGEQIRQIEVEGYLLIPDLLSPDHIARLKSETAKLETTPVDYSVHQRGCPNLQFRGGAITELLAHPPTLSFLGELFGDEIIMMSYGYARSEPGQSGHQSAHGWPTLRLSNLRLRRQCPLYGPGVVLP